MLFCVICIKGVPDSTGWIVRVPVRAPNDHKTSTHNANEFHHSLALLYCTQYMQFTT